jgi:hypothetical protein
MCGGRWLGRHLDVLGWSSGDDGRGQGPVRQSVLEVVGRTLGCSPLAVIAHQPSKRCDIARLRRPRWCAAQVALPRWSSGQGCDCLLADSPLQHWHSHWHCSDVLTEPASGRVRACAAVRALLPWVKVDGPLRAPPAPAAIGPPHHQASRGDRRLLKLEIRSSLSAHARSPAAEHPHCPPCLCLCLCLSLPPVPVRWRLPRGCTARHREHYFSARLGH